MKTKLLALTVLCVALFLPLDVARASDAHEVYWEWYSDATKTEVVGWRWQYCDGSIDADGYQSAYSQRWVGATCLDGSSPWETWCAVPAESACPAQCAWCTYY